LFQRVLEGGEGMTKGRGLYKLFSHSVSRLVRHTLVEGCSYIAIKSVCRASGAIRDMARRRKCKKERGTLMDRLEREGQRKKRKSPRKRVRHQPSWGDPRGSRYWQEELELLNTEPNRAPGRSWKWVTAARAAGSERTIGKESPENVGRRNIG